ncbi:uncharacterized protein SCHCODRAFT_02594471 [Schizophyllum commune H4-8]|nr:uncharacterized protein SCHCODRAFT_02594471 [Schizophyllum commune H4-8]KAI5885149.1 hypothetical protein SCHCODRAFT_02594471 [Schizophyllum commune H4-8]
MVHLPFKPGDRASVVEYQSRMFDLQCEYARKPTSQGMEFELVLVAGYSNARPPLNEPRPRVPPFVPLGTPARFLLVEPLQTDYGYRSQVWLARLATTGADVDPDVTLVFKFIIPSYTQLPEYDITSADIIMGLYVFPEVRAMKEATAYKKLADFQGSTIPYFFGMHNVTLPHGEVAYLLVFEYIVGPTLQEVQAQIDALDASSLTTKFWNYEQYIGLFLEAVTTLREAHDRDAYHCDIKEAHIIVDENNGHPVLIDWENKDHSLSGRANEPRPLQAQVWHDMQELLSAFFDCRRHRTRLLQYTDSVPGLVRFYTL